MTRDSQDSAQASVGGPAQVDSVVVLGAGVAGLAAAIRLREHGVAHVAVLERAERPGGLAVTLQFEGHSSDLGPHRLYTEIPEVKRFYKETAGPSMYEVERRSRMFLAGRFLAYPPAIGELLRAFGPRRLARFGFSWAWTRLADLGAGMAKWTCEGYLRNAFGKALYEDLVGPYARKVFKTDPLRLDTEAARVRVSAGSLARMARRFIGSKGRDDSAALLTRFHYLKGGAETLVRHMADKARSLGVEIHLQHEAQRFEMEGQRPVAVGASAAGGERVFRADRFISTIPLPDLAEILDRAASLHPRTLEAARSLRFLNMIVVLVVVNRKTVSRDQWIYFPEPRFVFNRVSEPKAFDPGMGPPERSALCCEITCRPDVDLWPETDEAIAQRVVAGLVQSGLVGRGEVCAVHVHRLHNAYPLYDLNYGQRLHAALAGLAQFENVLTAGRQGLFNYNNMDHSIFMGFRAADRAVFSKRPAQAWLGELERFRGFRIVD